MTETEKLVQWLRSAQFRLGSETALQDGIEAELERFGLPFNREHTLSAGSRPDFFVPRLGVVIEAKLRFPRRSIYRQIARYAAHSNVSSVILVSATAMGLPREAHGKPLYYVSAGRGAL